MNYQPFLGMNVLISDDLLHYLTANSFAIFLLALLTAFAFIFWIMALTSFYRLSKNRIKLKRYSTV